MVAGGSFQCFPLNFQPLKRDNQVAKDSQLLETARDCFYFTTKFFEPISVSATHIYHSALELSPISSIVRKLYYDLCHGVTRLPRVVIGTPDSWDAAVSISSKHDFGSCAWSPCGQFIAAQTGQTVEIRNHLTLELLTVLKSTKYPPLPTSPLAYSPDGQSIACGLSGAIVIWDIQTGGEANEIRCNKRTTSLAWSLDGSMVAITLSSGSFITDVETYNVFSGARLFAKIFESEAYIYLWAHEKSFRLIEVAPHNPRYSNSQSLAYIISEIGPTLIEIESSSRLTIGNPYPWKISEITFSPSTYHIAALGGGMFVYDIRTSRRLLEDHDSPACFQFSPDGSHFASLRKDSLYVFQRTSYGYTLSGKSLFRHDYKSCLQFSPTSSSILSQHDGVLQVRRLSDIPIASKTHRQYTVISRSGRRIATAGRFSTTVTIIDLHSKAPPQFVDTGFEVCSLDITGNVLVVGGSDRVTGWLLTEAGMVDGVFGNRRAKDSDRKWTMREPLALNYTFRRTRYLTVEGVVGIIWMDRPDEQLKRYHIETGEVLTFVPEPQHSGLSSPEISTGGRPIHHLHCPPYLMILSPKTVG